jgi:hypothetical protein
MDAQIDRQICGQNNTKTKRVQGKWRKINTDRKRSRNRKRSIKGEWQTKK